MDILFELAEALLALLDMEKDTPHPWMFCASNTINQISYMILYMLFVVWFRQLCMTNLQKLTGKLQFNLKVVAESLAEVSINS